MTIPDIVKNFLRGRRQAYIAVFTGPDGEAVLKDLARFCRANKSTFNPDPYLAARLDGRREVWLRLMEHIGLTEDQLYKLYGRNLDT
jgi:hypothetical protein